MLRGAYISLIRVDTRGLLACNSASVGEWGTTILAELQAAVSISSSSSSTSSGEKEFHQHTVSYEPGCDAVECNNTRAFPPALAAAAEADAIVVLLGLHYSAAGNATQCDHDQPWITDDACEGEGMDRQTIELPGNSTKLVSALRKAARPGIPLIGVLIHGGALALGTAAHELDAVVDAWYPGMLGARAIADVLFGKYNPAGRTAVTWYNSTAALPQTIKQTDFYGGDGLTYRYFKRPEAVLFPFGHGLSYTQFHYSQLKLNTTSLEPCDVLGITVTVTNVGQRDGDEVVQAYLKHINASVPVPRLRLAAFERVFVPAGKSVVVQLSVTPETHVAVLDNGFEDIYSGKDSVVVEAGELQLYVGGSQPGFGSAVVDSDSDGDEKELHLSLSGNPMPLRYGSTSSPVLEASTIVTGTATVASCGL